MTILNSKKPLHFVFACGGTAGHINPALALADKARDVFSDCEVTFIGNQNSMEEKLVKKAEYDFFPVKMTGFSRSVSPKSFLKNFKAVGYILSAEKKLTAFFQQKKPDFVVGTGGYMSYSALKTANKLGITTLLHESNSLPGLASKQVSKFADIVCADNQDAVYRLPRAKNAYVTGSPLRNGAGEIKSKSDALSALGLKDGFTILSFGGSLGSEAISKSVAGVIKWENDLLKNGENINHIHAFGRSGKEFFMEEITKAGGEKIEHRQLFEDYFFNMYDCYAGADLVISRAGAMTLSELKNFGKPSILIPWSGAAENHQYFNALTMKNIRAAEIITDAELSPKSLLSAVKSFYNDPKKLYDFSVNAKKYSTPDAAGKIIGILVGFKDL